MNFQKFLLAVTASFSMSYGVFSQVWCEPFFPTQNDSVDIFYDATAGNAALSGVAPVWAHMGVITSASTSGTDWKYVQTGWAVNDAKAKMDMVAPNLWKKRIHIQSFFGIPAGETALKLAFVFRNASGSTVGRAADGSDIFYDLAANDGTLKTKFLAPTSQAFLVNSGSSVVVRGVASEKCQLSLFQNGVLIASATSDDELNFTAANITATATFEFEAKNATQTSVSTFSVIVPATISPENPPAGTQPGLTVLAADSIRLSLFAPLKNVVFAVGDFSDWKLLPDFQMKKSLDGKTFWLDIGGVSATDWVKYQFAVEGTVRVADPFSTLILDPWNDPYIDAATWPNLPAYPTGKTNSFVSAFRTQPPVFNWQSTNFQRPKKTDLVIYEMLARDFVAAHNFQILADTLDYLSNLGVNAIELMPISEFDGNVNWGYAPAFHNALDKYYGSPEAFKTFVDACHQRGIAVILDIVFNQITSASPLASLWWDAANNRPATNNPYLNAVAPHPFPFFNDLNHSAAPTKTYVEKCLRDWIAEYRIDGYRFDLSKGFTQTNTGTNIGAWGQFDASRVAILKNYANVCWAAGGSDFFVTFEHLADNPEEKDLAAHGIMLWGNANFAYKEAMNGYAGQQSDLSWTSWKARGWSAPHVISYQESHDEERLMVEAKNFGNSAGGYSVKNAATAHDRIGLLNTFFYTIPGPKMLWQFGELGYDFSINHCPNGTVNNACRTDPKPIRWDYFDVVSRRKAHRIASELIKLRISNPLFETSDFSINGGAAITKTIKLSSANDGNAMAMGNFWVSAATAAPAWQHTGKWFDFFTGDSLNVTSLTQNVPLAAGEYRLYFDKKIVATTAQKDLTSLFEEVEIFPNPSEGQLFVGFSARETTDVRAELFDAFGKKISDLGRAEKASGPTVFEAEIDAPTGLYIVRLTDEKGGFLTKRVVVTR